MESAILAYAHFLGIDIKYENDLIWIAKRALTELPKGWEVCITETDEDGEDEEVRRLMSLQWLILTHKFACNSIVCCDVF